jgi:hypothetical protein
LAIVALSTGAAPGSRAPLQALTEADVGADALKNAACYAHDGPAVLVVATKLNAIVNSSDGLLLLSRLDHRGFPSEGARYGSSSFEIVISPAGGPPEAIGDGRRTEQAAHIKIVRERKADSLEVGWICNSPKAA